MLDIFWIENTAGGSFPGSEAVINEYKKQGVGAILTLTEHALPSSFQKDLLYMHLPIYNFGIPTMAELVCGVDFIKNNLKNNIYTFTHCIAGRGRTGTLIAAYLISIGFSQKEALKKIRQIRVGAVETTVQEDLLYEYYIILNS